MNSNTSALRRVQRSTATWMNDAQRKCEHAYNNAVKSYLPNNLVPMGTEEQFNTCSKCGGPDVLLRSKDSISSADEKSFSPVTRRLLRDVKERQQRNGKWKNTFGNRCCSKGHVWYACWVHRARHEQAESRPHLVPDSLEREEPGACVGCVAQDGQPVDSCAEREYDIPHCFPDD